MSPQSGSKCLLPLPVDCPTAAKATPHDVMHATSSTSYCAPQAPWQHGLQALQPVHEQRLTDQPRCFAASTFMCSRTATAQDHGAQTHGAPALAAAPLWLFIELPICCHPHCHHRSHAASGAQARKRQWQGPSSAAASCTNKPLAINAVHYSLNQSFELQGWDSNAGPCRASYLAGKHGLFGGPFE